LGIGGEEATLGIQGATVVLKIGAVHESVPDVQRSGARAS
jgi:hypothetical protein